MDEKELTNVCPKCGASNVASSKFCFNCGNQIDTQKDLTSNNERFCPNCGTKNSSTSSFCLNCGNRFNNDLPIQFNKTKKKKTLLIIGLCIIVLFFVLGTIFLLNKKIYSDGKRTILIYMVGSNLESEYGAASLDLMEIKNSGVNLDQNRIVIYAGGTKKWRNDLKTILFMN